MHTLFFLSLSIASWGKDYAINNGISFRENKGQLTDQNQQLRNDVLFYGDINGMGYFFKNNGFSYQFYKTFTSPQKTETLSSHQQSQQLDSVQIYRLDARWIGANQNVKIIKQNKKEGVENYYTGSATALGVKSFRNILYNNLYNNIDLKYYSKNGSLKYDYIVKPGGNYKNIQLKFEGAKGINLNYDGSITIQTPLGNITDAAPAVTQEGKIIQSKWIVKNNTISFEIADYDKTKTLIIDPLLREWGTFFGGNSADQGYGISVDNNGHIWITGQTSSTNGIATTGAFQTTLTTGVASGYLAKFNSSGNLLWSTYYGGIGISCNHDNFGNIYMAGNTSSLTNIATTGAYQTTGGTDYCFVAKFDSTGARIWGTYYGGNGTGTSSTSNPYNHLYNCSVDPNGNIFICGFTRASSNIATANAYQTNYSGGNDGFIAKFNSSGGVLWSTYYGGSSDERLFSCASNSTGDIYVSGYTSGSTNLATANAFQTQVNGGAALILKFDSIGNRIWSTYFSSMNGYSCTVDNADNVYIFGNASASPNPTTPNAYLTIPQGNVDAGLAKFNSAGNRLWSTYFGGMDYDYGYTSKASNNGKIYIGGITYSTNGIFTPGAFNSDCTCWSVSFGTSAYSGFFAEFDTSGNRLYGTYYNGVGGGGVGNNSFYPNDINSIGVDNVGNVYILGSTAGNTGISTPGSYKDTLSNYSMDAFLVKFNSCTPPPVNLTTASSIKICSGDIVMLGVAPVANASYKWTKLSSSSTNILSTSPNYSTNIGDDYTVGITDLNSGCTGVGLVHVNVVPKPITSISHVNVPCSGDSIGSITIIASGGTPPYSYSWANLPYTTNSVSGLPAGYYTITTSDSNQCTKTDNVSILTTPPLTLVSICAVTVDSATGKNLVIYEKTGIQGAELYKVYRETAVSGQYALIGTLLPNQYSTLLDTSSLPETQSYSYKMSVVDCGGNESTLSSYHKTIHLSSNVGINGEVNLSWNMYVGKTYPTNYIMRSVNGGAFVNIAQVASTTLAYTDLTPPSGILHYRIDIDLPTICNPTAKSTSFDKINSNSVDIFPSNSVQIIPNPTSSIINIIGTTPAKIKIMDALGRLVMSEENKTQLSMESLASGVYLVNLYDKNGLIYYHQKIIKK